MFLAGRNPFPHAGAPHASRIHPSHGDAELAPAAVLWGQILQPADKWIIPSFWRDQDTSRDSQPQSHSR